ncbi:hypothetical protein [Geotalea sp. SG265]|uniref:OmpL47-type beta-barrel domain-containing protein n=1 Tax=Geotalea sp. SG265 TaxID=2922867 RepID=UPI001FAF8EB6|nr:hypothetical protein [Geotalea sp. SG265]
MQKMIICIFVLILMHLAETGSRAGENAAVLPGSPAPTPDVAVKKKPVSGIHVGEPQYISPAGLFFVSPYTDLSIKVTGASGTTRTEYRLDDGPWQPYEPFRISAEGAHQIDYRSIDNAGNEESPRSFSVMVDGTPPRTEAFLDGREVVPGRPGLLGKKSMILLETRDEGSGTASVEYRLDEGAWQPYAPFTAPSKGVHTVSYRSVDNVGNREGEKTITITSERIPVRTDAMVGEPKYAGKDLIVSEKTPVTLTAESMSGVTSTEYRIDAGEWRAYAPFTVTGAGRHEIAFRSTDDGGKKEPVRTLTVVVDNAPPETSIFAGTRKMARGEVLPVNHKLEFTFAAEDGVSPVTTTEYRVNGGQWQTSVPLALVAEGKYLIEYRSSDAVGNVEPTGIVTAVIDATPPTGELTVGHPQTEIDGLVRVTPATVFQPKGTDGLSGLEKVEYSIDGRDDTRDTVPFTIATPGRYRIDYQAVDRSGNREPLKTMLVWVEGAPADARKDGALGAGARQFRFDGKEAAVPGQMPALAPFPASAVPVGMKESGPMVNAPIGKVLPESAYIGEYQAPPVTPQPYQGSQRRGNISLWEYITLGIVNISLILGVMLL